MIVNKYPATPGHTTVINNLCLELQNLGHDVAIGSFNFVKDPPKSIKKVILKKTTLLFKGLDNLNYEIIHPHQTRVMYYLLARRTNKPVVFHYHGASNKIQELNFKLMFFLYKNRISKFISVSNAGISQMKKMVGTINAEIVYNGVDTNVYNTSISTKNKNGSPQLLFVSALRKYKNTSFLIKSILKLLKYFPNIHLQIVGNGDDIPNLNNLILDLNLNKHVKVSRNVSDEELIKLYASTDIYVSASTFEVCPVPPIEAMSCGKPILLSDIEPHQEIVKQSQAGLIYSKDNSEDFIEKIKTIYENKEELSINARKFAEEHDWKKISKHLSYIYSKI